MKTLGIIGFGQFSQFITPHLAPHFDITVTDKTAIAPPAGIKSGTLAETAAQDILILATPVQSFDALLPQIAPHIPPETLVMDICSVKITAVEAMKKHLPHHKNIVATHPLFGPQSGKNGIEGLNFILCPIQNNCQNIQCIQKFAEDNLKLNVTITTAEEHDREMAYVHALTHLIGRTLNTMNIPDTPLQTRSYHHLLELCNIIGQDTLELFTAIQIENPYAKDVTTAFVQELQRLLPQ
ncbi:MAG: prephenate dehydrogenase/arogenate dehydrogenase family protein [Alphaproteobacteria bacterium]|nr:prephenate dehydrogenase/arogenate dehydrogenase family protein [Alphaproteobacteria bacterium]MDD9919415.1 prephenate dehydrogenase/arogenate dehydrogenase family protein [Alphaproteobacteria bacterium]